MRQAWPWLLGAGALLVVVGAVLFAIANSVDFGWSAYTPLEPGEPAAYQSELLLLSDGSVLWNRQHAIGAGLVVVGLLVLAAVSGWLLGRRAR